MEFSQHAAIDKAPKSKSYFADPFSSWQRGSNENLNGLVRQYIPKNRPLSTVTHDDLAMIQDRLNNRKRKRLRFKIPIEVFQDPFKSFRFDVDTGYVINEINFIQNSLDSTSKCDFGQFVEVTENA